MSRAGVGLFVEVRDLFGDRQLHARPVYPDGTRGDLRPLRFERGGDFNEVADMTVLARVDMSPVAGGLASDFAVFFAPVRVELDQAEAIVTTLRKVSRRMRVLDAQHGPVGVGDFLTYLTRVAAILGISDFYVLTGVLEREATGRGYRRLDAGGLGEWLVDTAGLQHALLDAGREAAR